MKSRSAPYSSAKRRIQSDLLLALPNHIVLTQARQKKGLTLQDVADMAGVNIRQYQKFESGERDLGGCAFSLGLRICSILDIDPQQFQQKEKPYDNRMLKQCLATHREVHLQQKEQG